MHTRKLLHPATSGYMYMYATWTRWRYDLCILRPLPGGLVIFGIGVVNLSLSHLVLKPHLFLVLRGRHVLRERGLINITAAHKITDFY